MNNILGKNASMIILDEARRATAISGEVVGVRADYANADQVAVKFAGIAEWFVIDDNHELRLSEVE